MLIDALLVAGALGIIVYTVIDDTIRGRDTMPASFGHRLWDWLIPLRSRVQARAAIIWWHFRHDAPEPIELPKPALLPKYVIGPEDVAPLARKRTPTPVARAPRAAPLRRLRQTRGSVIQYFPATAVIASAYVGFIIPIAIIKGNARLPFLLELLGIALAGCLIADSLALDARLKAPRTVRPGLPGPQLLLVTRVVVVAAIVTRVLYTLSGGGTLASQVSGTHSRLETVLSPLVSWNLFAIALLFTCYLRGACTRRYMLIRVGLILAVEVWVASVTTRTAPLEQFAVTLLLVAVLFRLVKVRTVAVLVVVVLLAWPTIFTLRNATRTTVTGAQVSATVGPWDRLRLDEQLTRVEDFSPLVPVNLGEAGLFDVLRFGIIPRALDSSRTEIASSSKISTFVGSTSTSSVNFLSIGTLYFFYGRAGLFIYYLLAGLFFTFLVGRATRAGPIAVCMMTLATSLLMGAALTFPDTVIGFLQGVVSFLPIGLLLLLAKRKARGSANGDGAGTFVPVGAGRVVDEPGAGALTRGGVRRG